MTKQDRQKLSVLIVLLGVLGLTIVLAYRMNQPPTIAVAQPQAETKTSAKPPTPIEAHIRLDLLENAEASDDIGRRNLFQYRQAPPPPTPFPKHSSVTGSAAAAPMNPSPAPMVRPAPQPPPPVPFKYQGFAVINSGTGEYTAFLGDDARHYNVTTGEILMGRYRVLSINETIVEIEDLEQNRRQILPLMK